MIVEFPNDDLISNSCIRYIRSIIAAMGIDAGFDMVPRLSKGVLDKQNWQSFIKAIKEHYQDDDLVEVKPNYIVFKAGEHPLLPFESHKFLRFSQRFQAVTPRE